MKCSLCGNENAENAKYCTECGNILENEEISADVTELTAAEAPVEAIAPVTDAEDDALVADETPAFSDETASNDTDDVIFCSNCMGECKKGDLVCRHCGVRLEITVDSAPLMHENVNKLDEFMAKLQNEKVAKIVSIISIVLCAVGAASSFIAAALYIAYYFETGSLAPTIVSFLSGIVSVILCIGFGKRKGNKLPVLGYILSAVVTVLSTFVLGSVGVASIISVAFSVAQCILLSLSFSAKGDFIRKFWYAPVIAYILSVIASFGVEITISTAIFGVIAVTLNAKLNWHDKIYY